MTEKHDIVATQTKLYRAILTLAKVPDPDRRFVYGSQTYWPGYIKDPNESFGWQPEKTSVLKRFEPTPSEISTYLDTLKDMTWLESQNYGVRDAQIIIARAFDTPWWFISEECGKHKMTVRRWHNSAVEAIHYHEKRLKTAKVR